VGNCLPARSSGVDAGDPAPSVTEHHSAVTSRYSAPADPIAAALEVALASWRRGTDVGELRRALVRVLAELG
jgi:hypothetical protein